MRVSSYPSDTGYALFKRNSDAGIVAHVTVGGVEVKRCTIADTDLGVAVVYVTDADGQLVIDPTNGELSTKEVYGDVEISWINR